MKRLTNLMLLSIAITGFLITYFLIISSNQEGFICLFDIIPLFRRMGHHIIWLTGVYVLFSIVSCSVFVGAFIHHYIVHKDIKLITFNVNNYHFPLLKTSIILWLWWIAFVLLIEIGLYTPGVKFRSVLGISVNYYNNEFIIKPLMDITNFPYGSFLIIIGILIGIKLFIKIYHKKE